MPELQGVSYALHKLTEVNLSCNPLGDAGIYELCMDTLASSPYPIIQVCVCFCVYVFVCVYMLFCFVV